LSNISTGHPIAIKDNSNITIANETNTILEYTFTTEGIYEYYCTSGHVLMAGSITINTELTEEVSNLSFSSNLVYTSNIVNVSNLIYTSNTIITSNVVYNISEVPIVETKEYTIIDNSAVYKFNSNNVLVGSNIDIVLNKGDTLYLSNISTGHPIAIKDNSNITIANETSNILEYTFTTEGIYEYYSISGHVLMSGSITINTELTEEVSNLVYTSNTIITSNVAYNVSEVPIVETKEYIIVNDSNIGYEFNSNNVLVGSNIDIVLNKGDTLYLSNISGGHPIAIKDNSNITIANETSNILEYTFGTEGIYEYYCISGHSLMSGSITINEEITEEISNLVYTSNTIITSNVAYNISEYLLLKLKNI